MHILKIKQSTSDLSILFPPDYPAPGSASSHINAR